MKSIISHFYNEEYLLPWWLEHHKKYFDYGLMINYNSTDRSVEIIKDICPDWQIVDSINEQFDALLVDEEVSYYEEQIPGWKIALNTTEFLVGNYELLDDSEDIKKYYIPSFCFVDDNDENYPDTNSPLYEQIFNGIDYLDDPMLRKMRCLHNTHLKYPVGRHFLNYEDTSEDFVIFNYGFAPWNEHLIGRKLQIQHRIPIADKLRNWGTEHHNNNKGLTKEDLCDKIETYRLQSKNLSDRMKKYLRYI